MTAFNFQKQFVAKIKSGKKRSTIRKTKRSKVGDTLHLYTGQRTKDCEKIMEAVCIGVAPNIEVFEISGKLLCDECADEVFEENSQYILSKAA